MTGMRQEAVDAIGGKIGTVTTYVGSGGAVFAGLSLTDWGVIVGIITAFAGLGMQFYFKRREDQRQERALQEGLNRLKA